MPLTPASPARRNLEAELFSPCGAEQSAAGQAKYCWNAMNIFIYYPHISHKCINVFMYVFIRIDTHVSYTFVILNLISLLTISNIFSLHLIIIVFLWKMHGTCMGNDCNDGIRVV